MSSSKSPEWTRLLSTSSYSYLHDLTGNALTTGLDGSIYLAGITSGDLDGQIYDGGNGDAFISKFNPDGTKDWTRLLGTSSYDDGNALTTGSDGSIYIAGQTNGDLDGQTNNGFYDAFISKFNPDGTKVWSRLLGTTKDENIGSLTTGSDGSIYAAGQTTGNLNGQTNNGNYDAFISKFNPDGTNEWTRLIGSSGSDVGRELTTGSDGSIYITGSSNGAAYISKFNPDGTKEWQKSVGTPYFYDYAVAITTGNDGSIYITGGCGNSNIHGYKTFDVFISKFNPDGTNEWTKIFGSSSELGQNYDYGHALTTGSDGSIYIAGTTNGNLDEQTNNNDNGTGDAFIIKYSSDGTKDWTILLGSSSSDEGNALTTGNDGSIYISGRTEGDLDGQSNSDGNWPDVFITKYTFNQKLDVSSHQIGKSYNLAYIKDYDGNFHANTGSVSDETKSAYKYQGLIDVNADGTKEAIYTNKESGRWVTASINSSTGEIDYSDHGSGGTTRVVGIYIDPLVTSGEVEQFGPHDSQRRFQNDLQIDNLIAKTSGDYDGDGFQEVYWKTNDGTAYLRALMHDDGNIQYANYQSEEQMSDYLTSKGYESTISDIV